MLELSEILKSLSQNTVKIIKEKLYIVAQYEYINHFSSFCLTTFNSLLMKTTTNWVIVLQKTEFHYGLTGY